MKRFIVTLVGLAAFALSGCTVETVASDTYESCFDSSDCISGDTCFVIDLGDGRRDSHCSHACSSDAQCPSTNGLQGACYELFGDPSRITTCFQRCVDDLDCFNLGFVCTTATMGGVATDAICVPE
jgi:hypothetical protein